MGRTSVSRRLVYVKRTKNPVAPLPLKREQGTKLPERAEPARLLHVPARAAVPAPAGMTWRKWSAVAAGLAGLTALVVLLANARLTSDAGYVAEPERISSVRQSVATSVTEKDLLGTPLPGILAQRAAQTDDSFRAWSSARRK